MKWGVKPMIDGGLLTTRRSFMQDGLKIGHDVVARRLVWKRSSLCCSSAILDEAFVSVEAFLGRQLRLSCRSLTDARVGSKPNAILRLGSGSLSLGWWRCN